MSSTRPNFPGKGTPLIGGRWCFRQKGTPTKGFVTFFVTLTEDEKQQNDADLNVYLRLQDLYSPTKSLDGS